MKMPLTSLFGLLVLLVAESRSVSGMTAAEIKEVVDLHNTLRASEGAADMEHMVWNNVLEFMARTWAARCEFAHGHPEGINPPGGVGQNLHMGYVLELTPAIKSWYNEKNDYNYDTLQCAAGKGCGNYTQVVWAKSRELGCAYQFCPTVANFGVKNAYILVCNYGRASQKPFTKGLACSKCGSGAGWCTSNGLCKSKCTSAGTDCRCAARCQNCATLNAKSCRCSCADGWHGSDCADVCKDTHMYCNNGWYDISCHISYVREGCPAMCKICTPADRPRQC